MARASDAARLARILDEKRFIESAMDLWEQIESLYSATVNAISGSDKRDWSPPAQVDAYLTSMAALAASAADLAARAEASCSAECAGVCRMIAGVSELKRQEALAHIETCKAVAAWVANKG